LFLQKGGYQEKQNIINTNLRFKKILNAFLLIATVLGSIYTIIQIRDAYCKNIGSQPVSIKITNNNK
jgi:predicted ATP-grasp superfamily ATP-dependent carboligase